MPLFQRERQNDLFALTSDEYLERFNVQCYFDDVVCQLLENRDDRPLEFISEYFLAVCKGSHVLHRGYGYVTATGHNRAAFYFLMGAIFDEKHFEPPVAIEDLTQLALLVCPDLPSSITEKVAACLTGVDTFLLGVGLWVYYVEFFEAVEVLFQEGPMSQQRVLVELVAAVSKTRKSGNTNDGIDGYGLQTLVVHPSKAAVTTAVQKAAAACAPSIEYDPSALLTAPALITALLTLPELHSEISHHHPHLAASMARGLPHLFDSVHRAHDSMALMSYRRRRSRASSSPKDR